MQPQSLLYLLAAALVVVGLIGTVLPALPGLPLVFAGMLLAAWAGGFQQISVWVIVLLGLLTLVSFAVDFWATAHGARRVGASSQGDHRRGARHVRRAVVHADRFVRRALRRCIGR